MSNKQTAAAARPAATTRNAANFVYSRRWLDDDGRLRTATTSATTAATAAASFGHSIVLDL